MPIVFTITLPDEGDDASLLVKKGSFAHLLRFKAGSREEMLFAMLAAQTEIEALEANPPQIEVPTSQTPPAPVSKDKRTKVSKPKKKQVSLSDVPDGEVDWDEVETEEIPAVVEELPEPEPMPSPKTAAAVQVDTVVSLPTGMNDVDGDPVPFQDGRILEIDHDAEVPRVWVESTDGEQDAWVKLADLESKSQAAEKPDSMPVSDNSGQLNLFS